MLGALGFWSALSMLPDVDVIGMHYGVAYAATWGHRGASHSLLMAIVVGAAVGIGARRLRLPALQSALLAAVVVASHGILDTMTDGGLGCALLWPFTKQRYFAPWRPIPVAPIGLGFLSARGLWVAFVELILFLPFWAIAVWPARKRGLTPSRRRTRRSSPCERQEPP